MAKETRRREGIGAHGRPVAAERLPSVSSCETMKEETTAEHLPSEREAALAGFVQPIAGSDYRQTSFHRLLSTEGEFLTAYLEAEPTNPYDPNAVLVTTRDGDQLGYLPRAVASAHQPAIKALGAVAVSARLVRSKRNRRVFSAALEWEPRAWSAAPTFARRTQGANDEYRTVAAEMQSYIDAETDDASALEIGFVTDRDSGKADIRTIAVPVESGDETWYVSFNRHDNGTIDREDSRSEEVVRYWPSGRIERFTATEDDGRRWTP